MSMTVGLYAKRKGWPLERVEVRLWHDKIHAQDCLDCETREGRIDSIMKELRLEGPLDDEQRARLREISERCPVHRTLRSEIQILDRTRD
jgi:putative redox protein